MTLNNDIGPNKAIASGVCGSLTTIAVYVYGQVTGHDLPPEIASAILGVITTLVVWFVPHGGE